VPPQEGHRGRHPRDNALFAPKWIPLLRSAVQDMSFLLTRRYAETAALKLVGDHYQLTTRHRRAVLRASCSDQSLEHRRSHEVCTRALRGQPMVIDGYNLLIAAESILSGGVLLRGRDGCVRDMASVHGSYRKVVETGAAIRLIGAVLETCAPAPVCWFFDKPVSNSGRLKEMMIAIAKESGWDWDIRLINQVDATVASSDAIAVSSDGWILDRANRWCNVTDLLLERANAAGQVIDLRQEPQTQPGSRNVPSEE